MRTKVVSFFIFFQELSNKKKIKALRPKMTKIASRGGPALSFESIVSFLGNGTTVKEKNFVGEKLRTFPSKTFRMELNFVLSE